MDLGPHATFIVGSYVFAGLVVGGLVLHALLDYRAQKQILSRLEARDRRGREA